jgi:hypothetical protein
VQEVFDTAELLEAVLFQLPIRDLLFAQKVCREWKQAIDASPKLQEALFFRSVLVSPVSRRDTYKTETVCNPLLEPLFRAMPIDLPVQNSLLAFSPTPPRGPLGWESVWGIPLTLHESWQPETASWRNMIPKQPAATGMFFLCTDLGPRMIEEELRTTDADATTKAFAARYPWDSNRRKWTNWGTDLCHVRVGEILGTLEGQLQHYPKKLGRGVDAFTILDPFDRSCRSLTNNAELARIKRLWKER